MVNPARVSVVSGRTAAVIRALVFASQSLVLVETDADPVLATEPSYVALAAALRTAFSSLPPLLAAFQMANS